MYGLWLDFDGPSPHFERLADMSRRAGIDMIGFGDLHRRQKPMETWIPDAAALIVHTGMYFDQEEVRQPFLEAIGRGTKVLVLRAAVAISAIGAAEKRLGDVNGWLTSKFDTGLFDDFHQDTERWADESWDPDERTLMVARPAEPMIRLHPLLADVSECHVDTPRVVRCFKPATRPLLSVRIRDVISRQDLRIDPPDLSSEDACVAAVWTGLGSPTAQVITLGDAGLLSDRLLDRADNARFASNLIRWLVGDPSSEDLTSEADALVDELDVTLGELVIGVLTEKNAPNPWWQGSAAALSLRAGSDHS